MNTQPQTLKTRLTRKKTVKNHAEDVENMTVTFKKNAPIDQLTQIANNTDWRHYTANDQEKNHIELAMDKFHRKQKTNAVDFFLAWSIAPSVIAERLRRLGYEIESREIDGILRTGLLNKSQQSMMTMAMMETLNDINKTLYKTNIL
jgi:D-alanyl-D-alanine carboxypeptidase